ARTQSGYRHVFVMRLLRAWSCVRGCYILWNASRRATGGTNVTAIGRLFGASAAAAVLLVGVAAYAQTTEPAKKPAKTKSVCNGLTEETACKANDTCRWIA